MPPFSYNYNSSKWKRHNSVIRRVTGSPHRSTTVANSYTFWTQFQVVDVHLRHALFFVLEEVQTIMYQVSYSLTNGSLLIVTLDL